ncbi:MAG: hypothetical protein GY842_03670, partial [bacterium]|nr:hypothetical protein [bacterium]
MTHTIAPTGPYPSPSGGGASGGIGSIDIFAGNFTPGDSEFTQGQLLPIAQNTALFSILGTT